MPPAGAGAIPGTLARQRLYMAVRRDDGLVTNAAIIPSRARSAADDTRRAPASRHGWAQRAAAPRGRGRRRAALTGTKARRGAPREKRAALKSGDDTGDRS